MRSPHLQAVNPNLEQPIGNGASVFVTHAAHGRNGLPVARVTVWNGRLLAADVIEPDAATDRRRLAKAAAAAGPEADLDVSAIDGAIMVLGEALHNLTFPAATPNDAERKLSASFPGLVDVVAGDDVEPSFLVVDRSADLGVCVVGEYTPDTGPDAGVTLSPPPRAALPWALPRAAEVLRYLEPGVRVGAGLFTDVVDAVKQHALLPDGPPGHEGAYYDLCAAFVFHTHYLEPAAYSPEIAFFAVPERGKSRTGRTLAYMSRRGVHTPTLREAVLFRDAQDRAATLFIDARDVWQKATKLACEDVLLLRFERGARVSRVLYPERGAFADTVYYEVFGPTILATNEPLGRILDTRCVEISMPLAPEGTEYPVPDEGALLPLRERLTAWRARQLIAAWWPAPMPKPAASRLGDVLLPLAQIIAHVAPDRLPSFRALAQHLEVQRRRDRGNTWEAQIVGAINDRRDQVHGGALLLDVIAEHVNTGRAEKERLSNRRIGDVLRSLGLETRKAGGNKAALVWDEPKIAALSTHYAGGPATISVEEEKCAKTPAPAPLEGAHLVNEANSTAPPQASPVSKGSVISISGGHGGARNTAPSSDDANCRQCQNCGKTLPPGDGTRCLTCELAAYGRGAHP